MAGQLMQSVSWGPTVPMHTTTTPPSEESSLHWTRVSFETRAKAVKVRKQRQGCVRTAVAASAGRLPSVMRATQVCELCGFVNFVVDEHGELRRLGIR